MWANLFHLGMDSCALCVLGLLKTITSYESLSDRVDSGGMGTIQRAPMTLETLLSAPG